MIFVQFSYEHEYIGKHLINYRRKYISVWELYDGS